MYFHKNVLIPRLTTPKEPKIDILKLTFGTIEQIFIGFPYGCAGLVGVRVLAYQGQILPLNMDEWIAWDEYVFPLRVRYPLWQDPLQIVIHTYNEDDTYNHKIFVGAEVLSPYADSLGLEWLTWLKGGE